MTGDLCQSPGRFLHRGEADAANLMLADWQTCLVMMSAEDEVSSTGVSTGLTDSSVRS